MVIKVESTYSLHIFLMSVKLNSCKDEKYLQLAEIFKQGYYATADSENNQTRILLCLDGYFYSID